MTTLYGGIPAGYQPFVLKKIYEQNKRPFIFVAATDDRIEEIYEQLRIIAPELKVLKFPAWDCLPYDRVSPGLDVINQRLKTLTTLLDGPVCILTSASALIQRLPPRLSLFGESFSLKVGMNVPRSKLLQFLSDKGYVRAETVYEAGEYALRGSLVDLFPAGALNPIRIDFFGDDIEGMREFEALSQKTLQPITETALTPVSEVCLNEDTIPRFRTGYRETFSSVLKWNYHDNFYESITNGRKYSGMEHWLPLFFEHCESLLDYAGDSLLILDDQANEAVLSRQELIREYYMARLQSIPGDKSPKYNPLSPELLYWTEKEWQTVAKEAIALSPFSVPGGEDWQGRLGPEFSTARAQNLNVFDVVRQKIQDYLVQGKQVIIAASSEGARHRLDGVLREHGVTQLLPVANWPHSAAKGLFSLVYPLDHGFETPEMVVISEQDILGDRVSRKVSARRKADHFFQEQLYISDLVVHREHGIARYDGLVTLTVNEALHDCLRLIYDAGAKLFLPVENIDAISRYGSDGAGVAALDRLGSSSWQLRKATVKKRIREVADYLIRLAAERALHEGQIFEKEHIAKEYEEFCAGFPYAETDDQLRAIDETLEDLASGKPMDRLICGDVGFGKTEIALRAAFVAAALGKQVAVIVPTTLLCRQHYKTFQKRFQGLPYSVAQLSRLVKAKEADQVRADLESGKTNIVIATQALLSDKIKFADLGLLVVDEEQHFGVKQKEKIKKLRSDVHVLTLTATPIPRTLQLALSGVREMSLITTPPVDRLAVRTFVMPYDGVVLREAILREYYRGGQIYYVAPRISDLTELVEQLHKLVPEIRITMAHGQMPATQLEEVMTAFYDREFDLLLSTNIIESGIDIASANTLIIHRADLFGLSQLYQLRGRVGRSKAQGYAYFTMGEQVPPQAQRRLEVMQSLDTLGAGFTLASHDMDIRGAGNIVGEEQSGHIREVGVELYQHLLQEAILMARLEQSDDKKTQSFDWVPQINLGTPVLIPEVYVSDLNLRLGLYRRIANLVERSEIDQIAAEMIDRFGPLPSEVSNLFEVIEIKGLCRKAGIEKLDVGPKGVVITFRENQFANPTALIRYLQMPGRGAKIRPDHKLVFMREWSSLKARVKDVKQLCSDLASIG